MTAATPAPTTVGSLFSGIGGMDRGLEQAGWKVVWGCEANEQAASIFKAHWPDVPVYPDVRRLTAARLTSDGHPLPDLIAGGSPCQDLSTAGRRAGLMRGERSNLFFDYVRLVEEIRPAAFVWENVPGLFSLNEGEDFQVAVDTFARAGYALDLDVLDSRMFGVAQRRRRIFAVGVRPDALLGSPSGAGYAAQAVAEMALAALAEHRPGWVPNLPAWASGAGAARRVALFEPHGGLTALAAVLDAADPGFGWPDRITALPAVLGPAAERGAVRTAGAEFARAWLLSAAAWEEAVTAGAWSATGDNKAPLTALSGDIADALARCRAVEDSEENPPPEVTDLVRRATVGAAGWSLPDPGEDRVAQVAALAVRAERVAAAITGPGTATAADRAAAAGDGFRSYVDEAFSSLFGPLEWRDGWDEALAAGTDQEPLPVPGAA